jgi:hypothetical protein
VDIKCKTCDIWTWEKAFISRHIQHQHWYTRVPPLYQYVEIRSIEVFWLLSQPLPHPRFIVNDFRTSLREFLYPVVNRFTRQTLLTQNRQYFFVNMLFSESFCSQNTHNTTLLFGSTFKHSHHFDYCNQPLNMRMRVCYRDCHQAGLCCYLVIHIENLLHALQLFISICILFTDFPSYVLGLRFSRPEFSELQVFRLSELLHAECWTFSNVSANIVVAVFRSMSLRWAGLDYIDLAVADGSEVKP